MFYLMTCAKQVTYSPVARIANMPPEKFFVPSMLFALQGR